MSWLRLVTWIIAALFAEAGITEAQQPGRVYRIGNLFVGRPGLVVPPAEQWTGPVAVYRDTLQEAGFVFGKNLVVESRHGNGDAQNLAVEAKALVASGVDVIVTTGAASTLAAVQATNRIPIVFWGTSDPVERGFVASLARPGGNVTGVAVMLALAKQWEFLREVAPSVRRAPWVYTNKGSPVSGDRRAEELNNLYQGRMKTLAADVGLEAFPLGLNSPSEFDARFAEVVRDGAAAVFVVHESLMITPEWRPVVMEMALRHRLPTSCAQERDWAVSGCLVTYAEDWYAMARARAAKVIKVLNGTSPADIPVEQPTDYKLIINAKTAKALGLTVSPSLLARADEVIE